MNLIRKPALTKFLCFLTFLHEIFRLRCAEFQRLRVEIATIAISKPVIPGSIPYNGPSFDTAVQDIQEVYNNTLNVSHKYVYDDNIINCVPMLTDNAERMAAEYYYQSLARADFDVQILFGLGCVEVESINRLAKTWNIVQITRSSAFDAADPTVAEVIREVADTQFISTCRVPHYNHRSFDGTRVIPSSLFASSLVSTATESNVFWALQITSEKEGRLSLFDTGHGHSRTKSPTWIAVTINSQTYNPAINSILTYFNWTRIFIVWDLGSNNVFRGIGNNVYNSLLNNGRLQLTIRTVNSTQDITSDRENLLADFRRSSRVMIFFGHSNALRLLMIYFTIQPYLHNQAVGNFTWKKNDSDDPFVKFAYRSVLILGFDYSDTESPAGVVQQTVKGWQRQTLNEYNISMTEESPFTRNTYNGMMMLAAVLNQTFATEPDFDFKNGRELAGRFLNRSWVSKIGTIYIDEVGAQILNLTIRSLNPVTAKMDVVILYDAVADSLVFLKAIDWANGHGPPPDAPICGYLGDSPVCQPNKITTAALYTGILVPILSVLGTTFLICYYLRNRMLPTDWWYITISDINNGMLRESRTLFPSKRNTAMSSTNSQWKERLESISGKATYRGLPIWLKEPRYASEISLTLHTSTTDRPLHLSKATRALVDELNRLGHHSNINAFIGFCVSHNANGSRHFVYVVSDYCSRGSLRELQKWRTLDYEMSCSLIGNLISAVKYIHSTLLKFHGNLRETKCLIDKFFTLKVGDFGATQLYNLITLNCTSGDREISGIQVFWTAPELTRNTASPNKRTDMYALAVIVHQIVVGSLPYDKEFISSVMAETPTSDVPHPTIESEPMPIMEKLADLFRDCWSENAEARPDILQFENRICHVIGPNSARLKTVAENILQRFQAYSTELEIRICNKTDEFLSEKLRCDTLLRELLPREVILHLENGVPVIPEHFESASVLFSSLDRFQTEVAKLTPLGISQLLAHLFDTLDMVIQEFRVYKVEAVGDSYMVAGGIPIRNGIRHVSEICNVAQRMITITSISAQLLTLKLQLKIGIHSGPCAGGIVGTNLPRYCLFGDTINVASRMCLTGEAQRIHVSSSTATLIVKNVLKFLLEPRAAMVNMKGKGEMQTYWLV